MRKLVLNDVGPVIQWEAVQRIGAYLGKSPPFASLEQAAAARKAHAQAFAGQVDAMADVKATQVPAYLPRRATPLGVAERKVEARLLNVVEACLLPALHMRTYL